MLPFNDHGGLTYQITLFPILRCACGLKLLDGIFTLTLFIYGDCSFMGRQ